LRLDDPAVVRADYADETRLATRQATHRLGEGPDVLEVVFAAVGDARPVRVLDIGCGQGELAQRLAMELGIRVAAVDQSPRMVELAQQRGVDARVGDIQALDFPNGSFDCVVAAWMLFHVPDLGRGLGEIARVLRPGGRLVAATNGPDHLQELHDLLGTTSLLRSAFNGENGEQALLRQFVRVERYDAAGHLLFPSRDAAQAYVDASVTLSGALPPIEGSIRVRRSPVVFVAEKA
jgi:SAM-dependent methyltransferase